jgi:hypothetical protein
VLVRKRHEIIETAKSRSVSYRRENPGWIALKRNGEREADTPPDRAQRRKSTMVKHFLFFVLPMFGIAAQDITFSKDSLKSCNRIGSYADDSIVFTNTSSTTIYLDSARIIFYELDTIGLFLQTIPGLQIELSEHGHGGSIGWIVNPTEKIDDNEYMIAFSPWTSSRNPPFYMGPSGDSTILKLVIANCLMCDPPKHPRYSRGLLQMYFSNGQTVALRFYSDDLRTATVTRISPVRRHANGAGKAAYYLINGRKIPVQPERINRQHIRYRIYKN